MLTSSPSPSTPSSPQNAFHSRYYHASFRNPSSPSPSPSRANSPRYTPVASSRRPTATATSASSASVPRPATKSSSANARSPKRDTVDAGTQYTPPGYPPTYRPPLINPPIFQQPALPTSSPKLARKSSEISPKSRPLESPVSRPAATAAPSEPALRVDPQAPAARDVRQPSMPSSSDPKAESTMPQESPSKRARPEEPQVKIMPLAYERCDPKDLGILISDMLLELIRVNDNIPLKDGQLTRFHSRAPPAISVRDYLNRLIVHATLSPPILLSMIFYVDRLCNLFPAFTISSLTVHRFLITAATVASKGLSDSFWTNNVYARVGGVSTKELALLEVEFLRRVEWKIVPKPESLVEYYKGLVERGRGYRMEEPPRSVGESNEDSDSENPTDSSTSSPLEDEDKILSD